MYVYDVLVSGYGDHRHLHVLTHSVPTRRSSALLLDMDVKPSDNVFDIGGNSMLAIQMSERVVKETGVRIKLMQLAVQSLGEISADLPDVAVPGARSSSGRLLGRVKRLLGAASVRD